MDKFYEVMEKLYSIGDPISAMTKVLMNNYMEFTDARECAYEIYQKRGYEPTLEFINMLTGYDLIHLDDRTNLTTFITMIEEEKIFKKQQKNKMKKYKKSGNFLDLP